MFRAEEPVLPIFTLKRGGGHQLSRKHQVYIRLHGGTSQKSVFDIHPVIISNLWQTLREKAKLSLHLIKHHVGKMYGGMEAQLQAHLNLRTMCRWGHAIA
jgi:hypothetical protein